MSSLFIFSLYLYLGSVAFFIKNSEGFVKELFQNATIIATQPSSSYRGFFKILTLTIIPTAYLSFFPIELLRTHSWLYLLIVYSGTFLFFLISIWLFYKGLSRYESGSIIAQKY